MASGLLNVFSGPWQVFDSSPRRVASASIPSRASPMPLQMGISMIHSTSSMQILDAPQVHQCIADPYNDAATRADQCIQPLDLHIPMLRALMAMPRKSINTMLCKSEHQYLRLKSITDLANSPNVAKTGSLKGISHTDRRLEVRAVMWQCFKESSLEGRPREPAQYRGDRVAQWVLPNASVLDFGVFIFKLDVSSLDSDRQGDPS
ncbi:hypothetical protein EV714DRAFT_273501 [Schizophyllum commune]